jgi:hypothetical protein
VYDAMRSQRKYQKAYPSERIRAILEANDGQQFDKNLVRRFVQLIGIYPPGNIVKLNTNEIGVVLRVYAPDPHRPRVRVVVDRAGQPSNATTKSTCGRARRGASGPRRSSHPSIPPSSTWTRSHCSD